MSQSLKNVLSALPSLSASELDKVRARVSVLRGTAASDKNADADMILGVIVDQMRGIDFSGVDMLRRSSQYRAFIDKVPEVMAYINQAAKTTNERRALLALGIELLERFLSGAGLTVGSRVLMANIHRLPAAINQQFPGYARAGMLGLIFRERATA